KVEELAGEYWANYQPLRDALTAVLFTPLNEGPEWESAFFGAGTAIRSAGLPDVPAMIRDCERWNIAKEDEGRTGWAVSDLIDAAVNEDYQRFRSLADRVRPRRGRCASTSKGAS